MRMNRNGKGKLKKKMSKWKLKCLIYMKNHILSKFIFKGGSITLKVDGMIGNFINRNT